MKQLRAKHGAIVKPETAVKFTVDNIVMYGAYDGEFIIVNIDVEPYEFKYDIEDTNNVVILKEVK